MEERLNMFDPYIIKIIESEYSKRKTLADKLARFETKELVNLIDYYRSNPFEVIEENIKSKANTEFVNIDDNTALKRALFHKIEKYYEKNYYDFSRLSSEEKVGMIKKELYSYLEKMTPEEKIKAIDDYKKINYKKYINIELNNAKNLYNLFSFISVDEVKKYISLYYDFRIRENLLDARIAAIVRVAKEKNVDLPLFMVDKRSASAVDKESKKITNITDREGKNDSLKERVYKKAKEGAELIKDNTKMAIEISALGVLAGSISYMGLYGLTGNSTLSIASMIFTTPLVIAGLTATYRKVLIYDNQYAISEAKQSGVLERKTNYEKAKKRFSDYVEELKKKYLSMEIVGGNNGLHQ